MGKLLIFEAPGTTPDGHKAVYGVDPREVVLVQRITYPKPPDEAAFPPVEPGPDEPEPSGYITACMVHVRGVEGAIVVHDPHRDVLERINEER